MVQDFFSTGQFSPSLNETIITLVPKVSSPEEVTQFRPISCCNLLYKVLSKTLTERMKGIMGAIITDNQSGFVKGRLIQDNVLIAHEIFHSLKSKSGKKNDMLVAKLDMSKAYDRLEWSFLENMLLAVGFESRWVQLIMACVTSVTYRIKFNGEVGKSFNPQRGVRQGDPISPYLFILAVEGLTALINNAIQQKNISGAQLSRNGPILSHLMFADDTMLITRAKEADAY